MKKPQPIVYNTLARPPDGHPGQTLEQVIENCEAHIKYIKTVEQQHRLMQTYDRCIADPHIKYLQQKIEDHLKTIEKQQAQITYTLKYSDIDIATRWRLTNTLKNMIKETEQLKWTNVYSGIHIIHI